MAEKEERIAVAKMLVNTDNEGSAKLDHFKIYIRQEAINRIAYALAKRRFGELADPIQFAEDENWQRCLTDANYVLNALL